MTDYEMKRVARYQAEFLVEAIKNDSALADALFPPRFMSIQEASEFCKIPVSTLYQKAAEIPHTKRCGRLIFSDRALTRWLTKKDSVSVSMDIKPAFRKVM